MALCPAYTVEEGEMAATNLRVLPELTASPQPLELEQQDRWACGREPALPVPC